MVLFLHSRYRTTGGEERAVEDLAWLVREHLGEPAELLTREAIEGRSIEGRSLTRARARAAAGLLRGGLDSAQVAAAVGHSGARVLHAHNLQPTLGWRALAAARAAGARVVLHLHQYRLVCATGVCFTRGRECTRCHGRNTLPGVLRNCRGNRAEALAYGAGLALWQHRLIEQADAVIVPSAFALQRLRELGAPLPWERVRTLAPPLRTFASDSRAGSGEYALLVTRLAPEKGVEVAIEACRLAGVPLLVAGDGPLLATLRERASVRDTPASRRAERERSGGDDVSGERLAATPAVRFLGRVDGERLAELRCGAAVALAPSRSAETFGLAAAEAMAAGVPVIASRVGALPELVAEEGLVTPGEPRALAKAIRRLWRDERAGERGLRRVRALCAPEAVAARLAEVYALAATPEQPPTRRP